MKNWRNKIAGVTLILAGVISTKLSNGDATALILLGFIGIPLLLAKENWVY